MIRLEGVSKRYGAGTVALDAIDLSVARGEVFGIIGRSGAGKSTLIRLLNGLERPSAGRVLVDGADVGALDAGALRMLRRRVGMIFQAFGLLGSRTVADNVAFPLKVAGVGVGERTARVADLLDRVGLADHGDRYPAMLSGGQKQRVGIARALATGPDILLCDEATSALDPETTAEVLALIADLNRDLGLTVLLITHEMDVVRQVCDRVAVLHGGRLVEQGMVADIFLDPAAAETRALLAQAGEQGPADFADFDGRIVRWTCHGAAIGQPVLTMVARETGADLAILDGRIGRLRDERYGQLTLGLSGGDTDAAIAALGRYGRVHA